MNFLDAIKKLFIPGKAYAPLPDKPIEGPNKALDYWYANQASRGALAHAQNQQGINNYISTTPNQAAAAIVPTNSSDFINKILLPITRKYNIPDPVAAGQFAGEGRLKGFGAKRNNFFNIAAYDSNPDAAIHYSTPEQGIEAYAKLIATNPHYAQAYSARNDPSKMLSLIQKAGYASRPDYSSFVMSTPEWRQYAQ